jgi:hypothetical protein
MRYRFWRDVPLIVTKPSGEAMLKKVLVYIDDTCSTMGFRYMDAGVLQNWSFDLRLSHVQSFLSSQGGEISDTLPEMK